MAIKVIPLMIRFMINTDCLAHELILLFEDVGGVDVKGVEGTIVHHCQGPVFDWSTKWAPNAIVCKPLRVRKGRWRRLLDDLSTALEERFGFIAEVAVDATDAAYW